jgi:hypothetical protein
MKTLDERLTENNVPIWIQNKVKTIIIEYLIEQDIDVHA